MALGSNIAERSRKTDFIVLIQMKRCETLGRDGAVASTKGYRRKTVKELETIMKAEYGK